MSVCDRSRSNLTSVQCDMRDISIGYFEKGELEGPGACQRIQYFGTLAGNVFLFISVLGHSAHSNTSHRLSHSWRLSRVPG